MPFGFDPILTKRAQRGAVLRQNRMFVGRMPQFAGTPLNHRTKCAQQSAPFSGRTLDVLAPLQIKVRYLTSAARLRLPAIAQKGPI